MATIHHFPLDPTKRWFLHAWGGMPTVDLEGARQGDGSFLFNFSGPTDLRTVQLKFRSLNSASGQVVWEDDSFIRYIRLANPADLWTFEFSARILYTNPFPAGASFAAGANIAINLITQNRFRGGRLYAWDSAQPNTNATFGETARDDAAAQSTFTFALLDWMVGGFHFKFIGHDDQGNDLWESDTANRVWTPADGAQTWTKSGQVSIRQNALVLSQAAIEMLYPASLGAAPVLGLIDPVEGSQVNLAVTNPPAGYGDGEYFMLARYSAPIYPDAAYSLIVENNVETTTLNRSFPADPENPLDTSRFVLGAPGWITGPFPAVAASVTLRIQPVGPGLQAGVSVNIAVIGAPAHTTVPAVLQADGTWAATVSVLQTVSHSFRLVPTSGLAERSPYPAPFNTWIDTRRFYTPPANPINIFTIEGMYGISTQDYGVIAEVPAPVTRQGLMQAAFGANLVGTGIFGANELPYGPTLLGNDVYFVFHSPHAVCARLTMGDTATNTRATVPMSLTPDLLYWWCAIPAQQAPAGTLYRFSFNDGIEVLDPAAREVRDGGNFQLSPLELPNDLTTSWTVVVNAAALAAKARCANWQTPGWESLVIYEIHAKRFSNPPTGAPNLTPFQIVEDELKNLNASGQPGYLNQLPVTAIQFLPLHEFKSTNGWGYNPSFFFAIESSYGGPTDFASLVATAHTNGKAVLLDVVYNHMLDSPLTQVAYDVYRNGDAYGDRINNAHPIVKEFFRQATAYLVTTFGLDGFRFDDTKTILGNNGWDFLGTMRNTIRAAAWAIGRNWPYCVMENDSPDWNATNPAWSIMDGEWAISEVYEIGNTAYVPWGNSDNGSSIKSDMDSPQTWMRPFHEATRFGESHDTVSGQNPSNKRLAARPPYGQGYQMSKALGALTLMSNGIPMLFMGQEIGETRYFSFDDSGIIVNPQPCALPAATGSDQAKILAWFKSIIGLRNSPYQGLQGDANLQVIRTGRCTLAMAGGAYGNRIFTVVTFGTPDATQDSGWLGLPAGLTYKEILNSSWPDFSTGAERNATNGGYTATITSGQLLNLPAIGVVVLQAY